MARWPFVLVPGAVLLAHLATLTGYGYFRDELYYLACANRLALGYVDHPPLSVALLWLVRHLAGDSVTAIRLLPALAHATTVLVTGRIAVRLGGGAFAASLAMLGSAVAPELLGSGSVYSMNALDVLAWTVAAWLVVGLLDPTTPHPRLGGWVWLGIVLGLGLLNKISVLWLGFGLAAGLLLTQHRRRLVEPGPWVASAIALLAFLPYVTWQIQNGWPTLEFIRHATADKMAGAAPLDFLAAQVLGMHPLTLPIWLGGLVFYLACAAGRPWRPLGIAYLTVLGLLIVNEKSRAGYLAPAYPMLFAAGGVFFASLRPLRHAAWRSITLAALALGGIATAPFALAVLPVERYLAYARALGIEPGTEERKEVGVLPQFFADMHGWDALVDEVERVYSSLAPDERAHAAVFTSNYGEAGALELLGRRHGLPPTWSGHNNYWLWGPPQVEPTVLIVLVPDESRERLEALCASVEQAGRVECGPCMPYENDRPVFVCRGARRTLAELWPDLKHFD